jgi:Phage integrase family
VWQLADAMPAHLRAMVLLAGFCGLRLGELILGPPKSEAGRRTIALPPFLISELAAHMASYSSRDSDGRVIPGERGGPLRRHVVQKHWARARATVDVPAGFRFHDLRHTANTLTAATGASTRDLMHRMGHASPQAALRYQHATRERDTEIAKSLGTLVEAALSQDRNGITSLGAGDEPEKSVGFDCETAHASGVEHGNRTLGERILDLAEVVEEQLRELLGSAPLVAKQHDARELLLAEHEHGGEVGVVRLHHVVGLPCEHHDLLVRSCAKTVLDNVGRVVTGGTEKTCEPDREVFVDQEPHALSRYGSSRSLMEAAAYWSASSRSSVVSSGKSARISSFDIPAAM